MLAFTNPSLLIIFKNPKNHSGCFMVKRKNLLPNHVWVESQYQKFTFNPSGASRMSLLIFCGINWYKLKAIRPPRLYPITIIFSTEGKRVMMFVVIASRSFAVKGSAVFHFVFP